MESLLKQFSDNNFLITCNNWFIAPDGLQYRAAWGRVEIYDDKETLGIKTNDKSTNWYAVIGQGGKRVIVAGCQIMYACVSMNKPNTDDVSDNWNSSELGRVYKGKIRTNIYLAQ